MNAFVFLKFFPKNTNNNSHILVGEHTIQFHSIDIIVCTHTRKHTHIGHISTISGRFFLAWYLTRESSSICFYLYSMVARAKLVYSIHVHGLLLMCTRSSIIDGF